MKLYQKRILCRTITNSALRNTIRIVLYDMTPSQCMTNCFPVYRE